MSEGVTNAEIVTDNIVVEKVVLENENKAIVSTENDSGLSRNTDDCSKVELEGISTEEVQEKESHMNSNEIGSNNSILSNLNENINIIEPPNSPVLEDVKEPSYSDKLLDNSLLENVSRVEKNISSMEELVTDVCDLTSNIPKHLTTSTISLNDNLENKSKITNVISRSAENISTIDIPTHDTDVLLAEYNNKKNKISATQIIHENIPQHVLDARYVKLNRENLTQDIGNIVKNVHGIFSSVSGSLKHVYSMSSKPVPSKVVPKGHVTKIPVNGRIINDIFEDDTEREKERSGVKEVNDTEKHLTPPETPQESEDEKDIVKLQVESLEKMLAEQRKEITMLRERGRQHAEELKERDQTFRDLEGKMDLMSKRVDQAEKDKDLAVMRYANSERMIIESKKAAQIAQKGESTALAEMELLNNKLKSAHAEKHRICQLYDDKCHELQNTERELTKTRDDYKELDGRLKWTQSKLRLEMDVNKEYAEKTEKLSAQVKELEAAKEAAIINAADTLRAKQLETELKECQASLIMCRHDKEDLDRRFIAVSSLLEVARKDLEESRETVALQGTKIKQLQQSNERLEEEAASLAGLTAQASLAEALAGQLQRETTRASVAEEELCKERARSETCSRREAAALEHAARLTGSSVAASGARERAEAEAQALSADNTSLRERVKYFEGQVLKLETALSEEMERRNRENRVLARKVAELTEECEEVTKQLEWEKGENSVIKKKHASTIKELNRELQRSLKRCEQLELKRSPSDQETSTRTGSISSLSSGDNIQTNGDDKMTNGFIPEIQVREPDKQALIERIVSLQRAAARRSERCDFLEEHSKQLTTELRKKSRILRQLMSNLPTGALANKNSDDNKKEIARLGGGAMAAVYGGDATGMTLELSIEMNRRLQAVLEDTLLKNITLKENMDTLGEEIEKLKQATSDKK